MEISFIIGLLTGLFLFICTIASYSLGVKHGKEMARGKAPEINLNPVQAVTKAVKAKQEKEEQEKAIDELEELLGYNSGLALEAIKRG